MASAVFTYQGFNSKAMRQKEAIPVEGHIRGGRSIRLPGIAHQCHHAPGAWCEVAIQRELQRAVAVLVQGRAMASNAAVLCGRFGKAARASPQGLRLHQQVCTSTTISAARPSAVSGAGEGLGRRSAASIGRRLVSPQPKLGPVP